MDAVEYIKAKKKACDTYSKCEACPLGNFPDGNCGEEGYEEQAVKALEKCLKENTDEEV